MNDKTFILNCPVDLYDVDTAFEKAQKSMENGKNFHIVTLNPEMVMNAQKDENFLNILKSSDLNIADGVGISIALKLRGINIQRIRGIDFSRSLIELCAKNNLKLALLGSSEEVILKTRENILKKYPQINIVFCENGYFKDENEVISKIQNSAPNVLLVGLGSPKQENLIRKLNNVLNSCIMIGVGGSFDVFSGVVKESPKIYRTLGLEWLYRTLSQPERLKRIFPTLPIFLLKCIMETVKKGQ